MASTPNVQNPFQKWVKYDSNADFLQLVDYSNGEIVAWIDSNGVGQGGLFGTGSGGGGAVASVFGRTGAVTAQSGDYSFGQVSGTIVTSQQPTTTVNSVVNDTNLTGTISAQALTLSWTGTLAAARLNANVVQGITNDTNVTGTISAQNLTLGWAGTLGVSRGGTGTASPALVAGTNITITGSWPNQTIAAPNGGAAGAVNATAQTASISATNLVASPSSASLYFIMYYLQTTTAGSGGTCLLTITWNDGAARTFSTSTISLSTTGAGAELSGVIVVECTSGAIQYSTTVSGATGSPQYQLQLQAYQNATGGGAGGSGTPAGSSGQVQFNSSGAFGASSNLFWDISNTRLGVATNTPSFPLHVVGDVNTTTMYRVGGSQIAFTNIAGTASAAQLPNPGASSLGGVQSKAATTHQFLTQISTSGVVSAAQPAFTDISGTVAAAQLPNPSASTLGGIESYVAVSHQWINAISTSGVPSSTQPAFTDISGTATAAQLPTTAVNAVVNDTNITGAISAQTLTLAWSGILPVVRGGTGQASPSLIAGSGVTITGAWPNQTVSATGGGGGGATSPGGTSGMVQFNSGGAFAGTGNFFWDPTNNRLGILTAAPAYPIDAAGDINTSTVYRVGGNQIAFSNLAGTIAATQLPNPSSTTLGGVKSLAAVSHQFLTSIGITGLPTQAQPAFTDISGTLAASQLPTPTASTLGGVESITSAAHNWIAYIDTAGVPHQSQPAFSDISGTLVNAQLPTTGVSAGVYSNANVTVNVQGVITAISSGSNVATQSLSGQTASISTTNIVASPNATQLYQINFYMTTTAAGTAGTVILTVAWNDGAAKTFQTMTVDLSATGNGSFVSGSILVKCTSGSISYTTTVVGATGSPQYGLDIRAVTLG